jgi:acetyl esterase/lipase
MVSKSISIVSLVAAASWLGACGNGSSGTASGTGGERVGSGGSVATGGTTASSGGTTGSGGGQVVGSGGAIASGGGPGTGGTPLTGGSTGAGGRSASGGTAGAPIGSGGSRPDGGLDAGPVGPDGGTGSGQGGSTGAARTITNLHYAGTTAASQSLDLLLPANARLPLPLVVRFHGGGFSGGQKEMEESGTAANAILGKGYALASVNYRLSGEALFPAGGKDAKAAVRWLRAHAADYGLDTDRFASWGESAGGYIAVLLGVTGDQPSVFDDDALGNPGVSSAVAAVVDWYGPVDPSMMDSQQMAHPPASCPTSFLQHTPASSPEGQWLGGALNTPAVSTKLMQSNLAGYIPTAKILPLFIEAHGDNDCLVPWGQSQELKDELAKVGNVANLTILAGASHADARFESTRSAPSVALLATLFGR